MKEYKHIEALLERYFDGQTTEAEEQTLKRFFDETEVPAHLQAEKEMFHQLQAAKVPEGLEERLESLIDRWDTQERRTLKVAKQRRILRLQWIGSIAASLLLLFGAGWYLYEPTPKWTAQDTCATPEEAYAQAQKALVMFSTALNKGMAQMEAVQETAERVEENVNKQLNKLNTK